MHFREREIALGRDDLILPLHYVTTDRVDPARLGACHDPAVLQLLRSRQWIDFRTLRTRQPDSEPVLDLLNIFSDSVAEALHRPAPNRVPRGPSPVPTRRRQAAPKLQTIDQEKSGLSRSLLKLP